jgi:hypothetical protein
LKGQADFAKNGTIFQDESELYNIIKMS